MSVDPSGAARRPQRLRVVVMGVAASGKSTAGELLARRIEVDYADADDFHSPANVAKMAAGTPLTDADRGPWLEAIGRWLADRVSTGGVVTCSALRRRYRDAIRALADDVWFLYCEGSYELIAERISHRKDHFMPASLLRSQFEALEPPAPDERAVYEDVSQSPEEMVADFLSKVSPRTADSAE
jgi:gluconokinase